MTVSVIFSLTFWGVFELERRLVSLASSLPECIKSVIYLCFETRRRGEAALSFSVARRGLSYRLALQVAGGGTARKPL